ncbi:MAG: mechanosensitive ion channel family protein [Methanoregulaceae archaeon]|nr:mechanosensitive ion channel family protein [Methanoregulaceae archaeon]
MSDAATLIGTVNVGNLIVFMLAALIVIFTAYLMYKGVKAVLFRFTTRSVARWTARFAGYLILLLGLYWIVQVFLGFDIEATIASLGIISIALAFASQQIISSLLAGFLIAINRTIALDDWVEIGGDPTTGISQVKDMTFTRTILKDRDGRVFIMPNSTLLSSKIVNYSKSGFIEIPLNLILPATIPFSRVQDTCLSILSENPDILPNKQSGDPAVKRGIRSSFFFQGYSRPGKRTDMLTPRVLFTGITNQGNAISIRFWIQDVVRREEITSAVLAEISKRLMPDTMP